MILIRKFIQKLNLWEIIVKDKMKYVLIVLVPLFVPNIMETLNSGDYLENMEENMFMN